MFLKTENIGGCAIFSFLESQFRPSFSIAAKPEYILAKKCYAARLDTDDLIDAKVLVHHLGLIDRNQVLDIVEQYIPSKLLGIKTVAFAEALFE